MRRQRSKFADAQQISNFHLQSSMPHASHGQHEAKENMQSGKLRGYIMFSVCVQRVFRQKTSKRKNYIQDRQGEKADAIHSRTNFIKK